MLNFTFILLSKWKKLSNALTHLDCACKDIRILEQAWQTHPAARYGFPAAIVVGAAVWGFQTLRNKDNTESKARSED